MHHIFYHDHCADGFAAATIARTALLERDPKASLHFVPCSYEDKPLLQLAACDKEDSVYVLDFSFERAALDLAASRVKELVVLDHHKTALPLADAPYAKIDMKHSGVALTWMHFYGANNIPPFGVEMIEWRDLGHQWQQPGDIKSEFSRPLHVALMEMRPRTFEDWHPLLYRYDAAMKGCTEAMELSKANVLMAKDLAHYCHKVDITDKDGSHWMFWALSHPPLHLASDALDELAQVPGAGRIAAAWRVVGSKIKWSLRSTADGPDCSEIAKRIDPLIGGGHRHAAGFTTDGPVKMVKETADVQTPEPRL
jgi:hypothetical protein